MSKWKPLWAALGLVLATGRYAALLAQTQDVSNQLAAVSAQIELNPAQAQLYLRRADLHQRQQNWDAAQADFERAKLLEPTLEGVDLLRARLFLEAGWFLSAQTLADGIIQRAPNDGAAFVVRGLARSRLGQGEQAAADFTKALQLLPRPSLEIYLERAHALMNLDEAHWSAALKGLDEGVRRLKGPVTLQLYALDLEVKLQRYDDALRRLEKVAGKTPRPETWLARRGEILVAAGRPQQARASFLAAREAIGRLPPDRRQAPAMVELDQRLLEAIQVLDKQRSD